MDLGCAWRWGAATSCGFCLWPLTRRKDRSALSIPAAVQRSTIWPSRHLVTLRLVARAMEIIESTGLLVVRVLASRPSMPSRDGEHLLQALAQGRFGAGVAAFQAAREGLGVGQALVGVGSGCPNALTSLASTKGFSLSGR